MVREGGGCSGRAKKAREALGGMEVDIYSVEVVLSSSKTCGELENCYRWECSSDAYVRRSMRRSKLT